MIYLYIRRMFVLIVWPLKPEMVRPCNWSWSGSQRQKPRLQAGLISCASCKEANLQLNSSGMLLHPEKLVLYPRELLESMGPNTDNYFP